MDTQVEEKDKKEYELAFIVKTEVDVQDVMKSLKDAGAEVSFEGPVNRIALAYPIKKEDSGLFGYACFNLLPEKISGLSQELRIKVGVLRF